MIASDKDTCDKFFAGINNTGDNIFPWCRGYRSEISIKPKIYRRCQRHRRKTFTGVNDTADKFFASVNHTADKTVLTIPACLDLKMKNNQKFNLQK
jgi:hypothetical protein